MTPDQERWAEALAVMKLHGDGLWAFLADRLTALVKAGDMAGVARWQEIIHRCDQLRDGTVQ